MHSDGQGKARRSVLILGATGPVGQAVAKWLAQSNFDLCLHAGHDQEKLTELMAACQKLGAETTGFSQEFQTTTAFLNDLPKTLQPDILICCYGPWRRALLAQTNPEDWQFLVDSNLALPGALVSRFAPLMAQRGFGRIVLFGGSTTDRIQSYRTITAWAAAKTGLSVLVKSAAREFGTFGVAINAVCPGYVEGSDHLTKEDLSRAPGGKLQSANEIANFIEFLCMDKTLAVNGAIVSCGGGL
jgi:3-oxoacyl-[acyl-carrier protein] reductase